MDYVNFLKQKKIEYEPAGIEKSRDEINNRLFDFQKDIVTWALKLGKAALFEECGLGKTFQQLEWSYHIHEHTGKDILILAPLAVSAQTRREGEKFGIPVNIAKYQSEVKRGINITNYERLDNFDPSSFQGIVLDESSILKSFSGKMKNKIIDVFQRMPFKLACSATPAPNDHMELGNHAEFLNIMPSNEMLARWFINDTMQFGSYRLKGHAIKDFWEWVASWAVCIEKPSDLGYEDRKFILPELNLDEVIIDVDQTVNAGGNLYRQSSMNATSMHKEMRLTAPKKAKITAEMVNSSDEVWAIWCNTNYEADELKRLIPDAIEVRGNEKAEIKEQKLMAFSSGDERVIITKPGIAGFGLNWQHCHNVVIFPSYSYEQFYQAIRRFWRFGQEYPVNVKLVAAETEWNVLSVLKEKMKEHEIMKMNMYHTNFKKIERERLELISDIKVEKVQIGDCLLVNADSVEYCKSIKEDSIHFTIFSPPFSGLYIYSDSIRDMGNCTGDKEFFEHFSYLIPELYKITVPGRLCAVHCKQLVNYKGRDGKAGLRDFRGDIIREFEKHGWIYHSEVCIWKDPVIEMQRTKAHGLLYKQLRKDSSFCRQGLAEYLLIFRKWAKSEEVDKIEPVGSNNDPRFDYYIGESEEPVKDKTNKHYYAIQVWQRYASPVWIDIRQTNVLNVQAAREDKDEKHICPFQLDIIERALELWTNPGDLVLDPFSGIGSTGFVCVRKNRKYVGIELKPAYFKQSIKYVKSAMSQNRQMPLFDINEEDKEMIVNG